MERSIYSLCFKVCLPSLVIYIVHSDFGSVPWQGSLRSSPLLLNGNLSITPQSVGETNHLLSHPDTVNVEVVSDAIGFGFSLRGGATEFTDDPLIIDSVYENGPAERCHMIIT